MKTIDEVYKQGNMCKLVYRPTKSKVFPYTLTLVPTHRMEILEVIEEPTPIGLVKPRSIVDLPIAESELDME